MQPKRRRDAGSVERSACTVRATGSRSGRMGRRGRRPRRRARRSHLDSKMLVTAASRQGTPINHTVPSTTSGVGGDRHAEPSLMLTQ
ncbi:hypothetical protein IG631_02149 [Alternaria alternata]|nr:hypothetical protein IG631_02149 [Alternaria alternata]